jgi:hypothetical protein
VTTQDPQRERALVVPTKAERVYQFHEQTLEALQELVQAAGLAHPGQITAAHIVRRVSQHEVKLLSNTLRFLAPGELLAAERGEQPWPHAVYALYWPVARAESFAPAGTPASAAQPESAAVAAPAQDPGQPVDLLLG